jgi:hypothetical protein
LFEFRPFYPWHYHGFQTKNSLGWKVERIQGCQIELGINVNIRGCPVL